MTTAPCRRCGAAVELSTSALDQIATLDRILASRGEAYLDEGEIASCRPCMLRDREEGERQSQAAMAFALRVGVEVRAGRMPSPEEMRTAKAGPWWSIVEGAIKAYTDEAKAKQQGGQERRPKRRYPQQGYQDRRSGT